MLLNVMAKIRQFYRTLKFKIILWYSIIFTGSSFLIFILAYYFLSNSIIEKEKKELISMLNHLITLYETKNYNILKTQLNNIEIKRNYFIEIKDNKRLFLKNNPKDWNDKFFKENQLPQTKKIKIIKVKSEDDPDDFFYVAYLKYNKKFFAIGEIFEETDDLLENFSDMSLILFSIILILGISGGYFITRRLILPINHLIKTMNEVAESRNFSLRMSQENASLELTQLINIFNFMLERIEKLINGMKDSLDYVAHDLKTPLTRLKNSAYSILSKKNPKLDECKEALIKAIEESEEIIKMLDSIMVLSEAEAGSTNLNFEKIDIKKVMNEIIEVYDFIAEEKNIVIKKCFIGKCEIIGDKHLIGRVIANVLDNAIKYSFNNSEIICSVKEKDDFVIIKIIDKGIGIDKTEIDKIFERLYRGDKSRHTKGHGLGLPLVKAIVELHNGDINVISEKNKGTTFIIKLPKHQK